jgi:peptide/nickel transport system substrate-binding protein
MFNDLRFRQALSLAMNRSEINETLFFGLATPFTSPASQGWTGYEDWMGSYYADYDVDQANALLDEMGLAWDSNHEWRLRSDGEPITIIGSYCTEWLAYSEDLLDLVAQYWAAIGIRLEPRYVPEETLQAQFVANDTDMGISNSDGGSEFLARSAYPIRLMPPWHWGFAGCCPMAAYPWRVWLDTNGADGIEPTDQVKELYALVQEWLNTPDGTPEYEARINEIIKINVENLYYFGTVSAVPQVWLVSNRVGNAPEDDGVAGAWGPNPYLLETYFIYP